MEAVKKPFSAAENLENFMLPVFLMAEPAPLTT